MESLFKVRERGSTWGREAVGGLTTFLAMAYIVAVNPAILVEAGVPFQAALTSTCLSAALLTITMGLAANRPLALAPGMGLNAVVAYTLCLGMGVDWRVAISVVLVEGLVIFLLVLCGLRRAIMDAIPVDLADGAYQVEVALEGGSGKATVASPAENVRWTTQNSDASTTMICNKFLMQSWTVICWF